MYPEICKLGPFTIYSYGLMLVIAFLVSSKLASLAAIRQGMKAETVFNFCFFVFALGIVGARIFYIAENFSYYSKNPVEIIMLQQGGLSWFGGLILGAMTGILYLKNKGITVYRMLDLTAPFIALGQAIGRIGCLLNGCCFGKESDFGIYFLRYKTTLIPTQLYSSLLLLLIFIFLRLLSDRPFKQGSIFFTYLLLYSIKRFFIEFMRADNAIILSGLTLFQLLSIAVFIFSLFKLILITRGKT